MKGNIMKPFIVYPKKSRIFILGLLSFFFVALGVLFLYIASIADGDVWVLRVVGIISILFFGFGLLYCVYSFLSNKPALIINDEGIHDNSSFLAAGMVKWEEILDFQWVHLQRQVFLGLITHDPLLIINRTKGFKKVLNKINRRFMGTQVNIPVRVLACSPDQIIHEIAARSPAPDEDSPFDDEL
jgi:hypothetical protein